MARPSPLFWVCVGMLLIWVLVLGGCAPPITADASGQMPVIKGDAGTYSVRTFEYKGCVYLSQTNTGLIATANQPSTCKDY